MGVSKYRSWSQSRQNTYDVCPRRWFWEYFPYTEAEEQQACFLKRVQSISELVGSHVHDAIELGLRQYKSTKVWPANLSDRAVASYRNAVIQSARIGKAIQDNKSPDRVGPILNVHLYDVATEADIKRGAERIRTCISNLEGSELFDLILKSDMNRWEAIATRIHEPFHIEIGSGMGFTSPEFGLRIYTAFDFAFHYKGKSHIIDWKTGSQNYYTEQRAKRQLAAYSLWGLWNNKRLDQIGVQAVWLASGPARWEPSQVTADEIAMVRTQIKEQNRLEKALLETFPMKVKDGRGFITKDAYRAHRTSFLPAPSESNCKYCKFRLLCAERVGKAEPMESKSTAEPCV
jgi:hypothetical protein